MKSYKVVIAVISLSLAAGLLGGYLIWGIREEGKVDIKQLLHTLEEEVARIEKKDKDLVASIEAAKAEIQAAEAVRKENRELKGQLEELKGRHAAVETRSIFLSAECGSIFCVTGASTTDRDHVKSLEKGLTLICLLSQQDSPLKLENLVKLSGMKKTSCFRILQTLTRLGFVAQDTETRSYCIGPGMISIGLSALASRRSVRELALPYMKDIRERTGATVNLAILSGPDVIFMERFRSAYIMEANLRVGSRLAAHCSSLGKAILAFLPKPELDASLRQIRFERKTARTITSNKVFMQELREIRKRGYALNDEELETGLFAIAAPLRNHAGAAVAAMNISFPLMRHSKQEAIKNFCPLILEACRKISISLGFQEGSQACRTGENRQEAS